MRPSQDYRYCAVVEVNPEKQGLKHERLARYPGT